MDAHTVAHHTTVVSTCPTLRSKTLSQHFLLFMLGVYTVSTYFYYTKAILTMAILELKKWGGTAGPKKK